MTVKTLQSYANGMWFEGDAPRPIESAVTGDILFEGGSDGLGFEEMAHHARRIGGPSLRAMTFHQRAHMLKALAQYLNERRDALYELSYNTGATKADSMIDIDGGISTMFVFASKGRRELPDEQIFVEGGLEQLSRAGNFLGQHVCTPLQGVAVHINAYNFPVWGMLEKLAPTLLAGVPAIVKPATATSYVTEACFRMMVESGILPDGTVQLIIGSTGDLLDHLGVQDVVSFTGSASTAMHLRQTPNLIRNATRFVAEQDSLNAAILGADATPDTPEFDAYIKEVSREMTAKAGQKCTAVRRILVPRGREGAIIEALTERLQKTRIGHPALETTRMGALAGQSQRRDVLAKLDILRTDSDVFAGDMDRLEVDGADAKKGAFMPPFLLYCDKPDEAESVHSVEAFGPVATVMPYEDTAHAAALANKGLGSLVASVFTHDPKIARDFVMQSGAFHGRLYFANRDTGKEATGHGSPLPHLTHGGPGRAGGGEEMGGIRGVMHYMQRTAIQASPDLLTGITKSWVRKSQEITKDRHPFRKTFGELEVGETFHTAERTITLEDIEHFAHFTGDTFYAHMDEEAASANPFFPGRVAHGYLLLSFAAGLFVDPDPGPVLANYGLNNLRFTKPVSPGDAIKVRLTAKDKTVRNEDYGEVRWDVEIVTGNDEPAATYELLTMNAR